MRKSKEQIELEGHERELKMLVRYRDGSTSEAERDYLWRMIQGTQRRIEGVKGRIKPFRKKWRGSDDEREERKPEYVEGERW